MYEYPLQLSFKNNQYSINPFIFNKKVKVYSYKNENRSPSISYSGLKYVGNGLVNVDLLDKFINISIDVRDIRQLNAYSLDGKYLGELSAPKSWQSQPLSLTTLRHIKKQVKKQGMLSKDYHSGYFNHLLNKKHYPKVATEIVRVAREFGTNKSTIKLSDNKVKNIEVSNMGLDHKNGIAKWSPKLNSTPVRKDI